METPEDGPLGPKHVLQLIKVVAQTVKYVSLLVILTQQDVNNKNNK
jgi:hypothetical protein